MSSEETISGSYSSQEISTVVGAPLIVGIVSLVCCTIFFAFAVHREWIDELAPRVANRPKAVMKNALLSDFPEHCKNKLWVYPFALLYWAYKITYRQCLAGIPGTGTRKNGWEGPLLKTNLDAVVFLKYQALLFKISIVVGLLCSFVIMPINITAGCDVEIFGEGTCAQLASQTGFVQTTIAHIPDKIYNNDANATASIQISLGGLVGTFVGKEGSNSTLQINNITNTTDSALIATDNVVDTNQTAIENIKAEDLASAIWIPDQSWRIMVTCISCILIYIYTMYLVWHEWVENVALRRAFFLEMCHYGQRMIELNKLDLDFVKHKNIDYGSTKKEQYDRKESRLPPYLTHPEVRETPPSIGLYSVLYRLPNSMVTYDTDGATSVERQLVATTKFFDTVVPPQPGFSSSVIAVTMIPHAKLVAKCWQKWNAVEGRLQKLRYIKTLLEKGEKPPTVNDTVKRNDAGNKTRLYSKCGVGDIETLHMGTDKEPVKSENYLALTKSLSKAEKFNYEDFNIQGYARSLGFSEEVDMVSGFVDGMGIEEFNVFAYTCALKAGGPGVGLKVLNLYDDKKLREEEEKVLEELDHAHQELLDARSNVLKLDEDQAVPFDDQRSDGIPSLADVQSGSSIRLADAKNEWEIEENEFEQALQMLDSLHSEIDIQKEKKCSCLRSIFKRILIGQEITTLESEYFGLDPQNNGEAYKTDVKRPSYAVITFASRYHAIVARQCLADGVASNNWMQVDDLPIYPLADAPANMWTYPKGFMRPVTLTISYSSKKFRRWLVYIFLTIFIGSFTWLINVINNFLWDPELYAGAFGLSEETLDKIIPTLSGLTQTMVFAVCPQVFMFVANKEGAATSLDSAQKKAIIYFWYFFLVVRYLGQLVVQSFVSFFEAGDQASIEQVVIDAISEMAKTAPTILGPAALTYIIFAGTITWPALYMLQLNNFWTSLFRLGWINRILKGGGPGQEISYRIYVDSAYVLSCMTTLAPVCPLIGPICFMYFALLAPMVRFLVIFAYRPKYDSGGDRWPAFHHMIISSLILGQIVTMFTFLLKGNYVLGIIIGLCSIPTLLFDSIVREKFSRPFHDASLRFTGKMQNKCYEDTDGPDPWQEREEFRRWLVDCHKASYLPTCLSGGDKNLLTAEPAIVVPKVKQCIDESAADHYNTDSNMRNMFKRQSAQKGGVMRRQRYGI